MTTLDDALTLFKAWYGSGMPRLYKYVWYRVRETATAEELTATICERALAVLERYDPQRGVFEAWVFGIAHNVLRQHFRSQSRQPALVTLEHLPPPSSNSRPVEQIAQQREAAQIMLNLLATFPERDQEIVALRYGAGFAHQEIAELTGLTENHVAVQLHRTIKKLREALDPELITLGDKS